LFTIGKISNFSAIFGKLHHLGSGSFYQKFWPNGFWPKIIWPKEYLPETPFDRMLFGLKFFWPFCRTPFDRKKSSSKGNMTEKNQWRVTWPIWPKKWAEGHLTESSFRKIVSIESLFQKLRIRNGVKIHYGAQIWYYFCCKMAKFEKGTNWWKLVNRVFWKAMTEDLNFEYDGR
jgi:hypothetical protein